MIEENITQKFANWSKQVAIKSQFNQLGDSINPFIQITTKEHTVKIFPSKAGGSYVEENLQFSHLRRFHSIIYEKETTTKIISHECAWNGKNLISSEWFVPSLAPQNKVKEQKAHELLNGCELMEIINNKSSDLDESITQRIKNKIINIGTTLSVLREKTTNSIYVPKSPKS